MCEAHRVIVGAWLRFARRYGWRAYALPILTVITVAALLQHSPGAPARQPPAAGPVHVEGAEADFTHFQPGATPTAAPVIARRMTESDSCAGNGYARLVLVDLSRQHAWMCDGQRQVYTTAVTSGASAQGNGTPLGSWRVQAKQRDRYLVGPGYRDYVRFWVPFNGDYGLHDASWQTMRFGSSSYVTQGSHGCVHLPTPAMRWLYAWARVGETVVTIAA